MVKISFLILTFNSSKHIRELIESFVKQCGDKIKNGAYELIILDNDSTDDTFEIASKYKRDNVRVTRSSKNLGYAAGINKVFKDARGKYICIINPDAEIISAKFDDMTEEFEKDQKLAVAGGRVETYQDTVELTAGKFYNFFSLLGFSLGLENFLGVRFAPKGTKEVDFVSGGFMMVESKLFENLKGFDERYFMYIEDMDLCFRAKKLGYRIKYIPKAVIKHRGQGSSNREFAIVNIYKGLLYFYEKHKSKFSYSLARTMLKSKAILLIALGTVTGDKTLAQTYSKALRV